MQQQKIYYKKKTTIEKEQADAPVSCIFRYWDMIEIIWYCNISSIKNEKCKSANTFCCHGKIKLLENNAYS